MKIGLFYFRSLYSQSAASLTVGKFSSYLLDRGYETKLNILSTYDYGVNLSALKKYEEYDYIIYKANFKDFNYGIELFKNLNLKEKKIKFILTGPFCVLNKKAILKKYDFVNEIIDIQTLCHLEDKFPTVKERINKPTVFCGVDREIEKLEKGSYINLESSTGCVNHCNFCHINLTKQPFTLKDMSDVVDEIKNLYLHLNKRYFIFNDSLFYKGSKDEKRILEFCNLLKENNLKIYFYIYLALSPLIPEYLLDKLKEVGLIRVFFGIESITNELQINNEKQVSEQSANNFISLLKKKNISYHIGFMLFYPEITLSGILKNIEYLHDIKKLFRLGIIVEKMRILPNSPNNYLLTYDESQIDQAYNYSFNHNETGIAFKNLCAYFSNIDIRLFEQYLTGYNIALTILERENKLKNYINFSKKYEICLNKANDFIFENIIKIINSKKVDKEQVINLKNLQAELEIAYLEFMNFLNAHDNEIYKMIPVGKEDINL